MESGGNTSKGSYAQVVELGEHKAFDFFFRQYYSALCFFANSIINNEDEAKDIVQDSFIKLWNGHAINDRSDTVKSFLYTTVRNKCVDHLRKRKTIKRAESHLIKNKTTDFEYFDEVAFAEMMRQVTDRIGELPESAQQILKCYYIDGKKHHEIANEINSTSEAVRKQKARALKAIRQKFFFLLGFLFSL